MEFCPEVRDEELHSVLEFLSLNGKASLQRAPAIDSRIFLLVGNPGTGKTEMINHILNSKDLPASFRYVIRLSGVYSNSSANRTTLGSFLQPLLQQLPAKLFADKQTSSASILKSLKRGNKTLASRLAEVNRVANFGRRMIIVIDEIDRLGVQELHPEGLSDVRENACSLLSLLMAILSKHLRFVTAIALANDSDVTERIENLLGVPKPLPFVVNVKPYTLKQLQTIARYVKKKGSKLSAGEEFGLRKIAAHGGDCRQMLDMLERVKAAEEEEKQSSPTRATETNDEFNIEGLNTRVSVIDQPIRKVQAIIEEYHETDISKMVRTIKALPLAQQVIMASLGVVLLRDSPPIDSGILMSVYNDVMNRLPFKSLKLTAGTLLHHLKTLKSANLIDFRLVSSTYRNLTRTPQSSRSRRPLTPLQITVQNKLNAAADLSLTPSRPNTSTNQQQSHVQIYTICEPRAFTLALKKLAGSAGIFRIIFKKKLLDDDSSSDEEEC